MTLQEVERIEIKRGPDTSFLTPGFLWLSPCVLDFFRLGSVDGGLLLFFAVEGKTG